MNEFRVAKCLVNGIISEDDNIENPLAAKSFFKSNHIYNKFTICQLDTSKNSKIYVTGKK